MLGLILGADVEGEPVVVAVWLDDQVIVEGTVPYDPTQHCNWTESAMEVGPGPHRIRVKVFTTDGGLVLDQVGVWTSELPEFHDEIAFSIDGPATGFLDYERYPEEPSTHGFCWHLEDDQRQLFCL